MDEKLIKKIPKVTIEQITKITVKLKDNPEELKRVLRYFFRSPKNIGVFGKFFFPEAIIGTIPKFHEEFYEFLITPRSGAMAAPRGHAKSTTAGFVYPIWNIVNKIEAYTVYVSQNHSKTVQFLTPLRFELKNNALLHMVYGQSIIPGVDPDDKDREDCVDANGCRIEAVSFEKNLRGFKYKNIRPTLIIGDDIESDERILNPVLRDKDTHKLNKVIIPSLDINGRFKMIGTILHLDSLLIKKLETYKGKIYKAIDGRGKLLWPERFTQAKLDQIKADIGSVAFEQEYLNNPIDNSVSIIKSQWVKSSFDKFWDYSYDDFNEIYLGVDFAFSDRVAADASSFMDIGVKYNGDNVEYHILNMRREQGMSINEQMTYVDNLHKRNNYSMIGFEENSIKSASKDIKKTALPIKMFWMGNKDQKDKMTKDPYNDTNTISKINAINRLSLSIENKKWVIPYRTPEQKEMANYLMSELCSWSLQDGKLVETGVHPDQPISMILVMEMIERNKVIVM